MILAFTGPRPQKLGGFDKSNPLFSIIRKEIEDFLIAYKPTYCITGMALGVDQIAAEACINLGIPFFAAIPCKGQELRWPEESQKQYHYLLSKATDSTTLADTYSDGVMQQRNKYMVDKCSHVLAIWDGTPGGTANCIKYAYKQGKPITILDLKTMKLSVRYE